MAKADEPCQGGNAAAISRNFWVYLVSAIYFKGLNETYERSKSLL